MHQSTVVYLTHARAAAQQLFSVICTRSDTQVTVNEYTLEYIYFTFQKNFT